MKRYFNEGLTLETRSNYFTHYEGCGNCGADYCILIAGEPAGCARIGGCIGGAGGACSGARRTADRPIHLRA